MKWIHFLSISKCCISKYTSIWCSHNHTLLVLVFFLAKESNNFTFMVPLVEPYFKHVPLMTPNLSTIQPMSLAVLLLCVVVSPCCTTNIWKTSRMAKTSLDILSTTFGLVSSHVLGDLCTFRCSSAYLFPFFSFFLF